ncbi:MAG: DUF222 domain-containing protein [Ilumatobacteraceae bacterium]
MPGTRHRVEAGTLGLDHLQAYADATRGLDEHQQAAVRAHHDELLADVGAQTAERFAGAVRRIARQVRQDDGEPRAEQQRKDRSARCGPRASDGMTSLVAQFDPETGARAATRLSERAAQLRAADPSLSVEQSLCDALADLILAAGRATTPGLSEVVVFIDLESLLHGAHEAGVSYLSSGEHLPVSAVRRLCCEAKIVPMVLGGEGEPLDLGRGHRTANRAQRRALRKLYRSCAHPDCEVPFDDCHVHHVDFWNTAVAPISAAWSRLQPTPPPRPRPWLATHPGCRPHRSLVPTRRRTSPNGALDSSRR